MSHEVWSNKIEVSIKKLAWWIIVTKAHGSFSIEADKKGLAASPKLNKNGMIVERWTYS